MLGLGSVRSAKNEDWVGFGSFRQNNFGLGWVRSAKSISLACSALSLQRSAGARPDFIALGVNHELLQAANDRSMCILAKSISTIIDESHEESQASGCLPHFTQPQRDAPHLRRHKPSRRGSHSEMAGR
jgi:hypothetical protein